jgi:xanthine dehydrogenase accessory factor
MENLDVRVLRQLRDWRSTGKAALLATVVRTWGSSPRPIGSIMALCEDGTVVGSVSGGCIEDDLIYRYAVRDKSASKIIAAPPEWVKYGVSADEAHRFGLPCGGTLELLLEYNPDAQSLTHLVATLESGKMVARSVRLADGIVTCTPATIPAALEVNDSTLVNTFGPEYRLLMIGGGQLTEYVATMALFSGFAVTVCDPREEYHRGWSVANVTLLTDMPDDVVREFKPDRRTCVLALTHDPKLDDLALLEAISSEAFYVGAIGSRRNNESRKQRMIEHFDQTEQSLAALRGPIGIYIGSKTPAEIAVSIMAEVLAAKNGVVLPRDLEVAHAKNLRNLPRSASE